MGSIADNGLEALEWQVLSVFRKIGISATVMGRYECAEIVPSVKVAQKFARTFGVSVDYPIGWDDIPDVLKAREIQKEAEKAAAIAEKEMSKIHEAASSETNGKEIEKIKTAASKAQEQASKVARRAAKAAAKVKEAAKKVEELGVKPDDANEVSKGISDSEENDTIKGG